MITNNNNNVNFFIVYICCMFGFILSKGLSLFPAMGLDDYVVLHVYRDPIFLLGQGRFTHAAIQLFLDEINLSPTSIHWPAIILFFTFASLAITLGILYVSNRFNNVFFISSVGFLIACYPYMTEYFTFRESLITQSFSFFLMASVFLLFGLPLSNASGGNAIRKFYIVFVLFLLAGTQQTVFILLGFFIFSRFINENIIQKDIYNDKSVYEFALMYIGSAFIYIFAYICIHIFLGAPLDDRSNILSISEIKNRIGDIALLSNKIFLKGEPTLSFFVKAYIYIITICFSAYLLFSRRFVFVVLIGVFILFYTGSIFLVSVSSVWWPVPRAVYGVGFAWGILLLLIGMNIPEKPLKIFGISVFIGGVLLSFNSSAILHDQIRLNRWDAWAASSIAQELIRTRGNTIDKTFLVGARWAHDVRLRAIDGDLNTSALAVPWAANHLFMEVTGRTWRIDSIPSAPECDGVEMWPANGSIRVVGDSVFVCLGSGK